MKSEVIEYLNNGGTLESLEKDFNIVISTYPDRFVLNYNQIESPKFHPICDECRGLIIYRDNLAHSSQWKIMGRGFDRFYNIGEGERWREFPFTECRIEEKRDGSLILLYWDKFNNKWQISTRKMAYGEGSTPFGITYRELFDRISCIDYEILNKNNTYIFEITSPLNRVVTPYSEDKLTLIGIRNVNSGAEYNGEELDYHVESGIFVDRGIIRPIRYSFNNLEEMKENVERLGGLMEGYVLTDESKDKFWRLKLKSSTYLAVAHIRENGKISPKRICVLILNGEDEEYLTYFKEDEKLFAIVRKIIVDKVEYLSNVYERNKGKDQKEFALSIMGEVSKFDSGILFRARKFNKNINDIVKDLGGEKISEGWNIGEEVINHS